MSHSPWGHKELDTTERAQASVHTHTHTHTRLMHFPTLYFIIRKFFKCVGRFFLNAEMLIMYDFVGKKKQVINIYQFSSVAQLCLTLCDLMDCRLPYLSPTPGAYSNSCPSRQ